MLRQSIRYRDRKLFGEHSAETVRRAKPRREADVNNYPHLGFARCTTSASLGVQPRLRSVYNLGFARCTTSASLGVQTSA